MGQQIQKKLVTIAYTFNVVRLFKSMGKLLGLWQPVHSVPTYWNCTYIRDYHAWITDSGDRLRNQLICTIIKLLASDEPRILDLGCGSGALRQAIDFSFTSYLGIDFSEEAISLARQHQFADSVFHVQDIAAYPNLSNAFEVIVFNEVLYYLNDFAYQFERYLNSLSPNGVLIVSMITTPKSTAIFKRIVHLREPEFVIESIAKNHMKKTTAHFKIAAFLPEPKNRPSAN